MARMTVNLASAIHAEIRQGDFSMLPNTSVILDPLTKSYSDEPLVYYNLSIVSLSGISNPVLLQNGKNSRFSASGRGTVQIKLTIEDAVGKTASHTITINVG